MLKNLRVSEKKILLRQRMPEGCCGSALEQAKRILDTLSRQDLNQQEMKVYAFAALDDLEWLGNGEVTDLTAPLVNQACQFLRQTDYRYNRTLLRALNSEGEEVDFSTLFSKAAQQELNQQQYGLARQLALHSLRVEYSRVERKQVPINNKVYESLLVLAASYARINEVKRALEVQQEAINCAKDEDWFAITQDPVGNVCLIPAFEGAAIDLIKAGDLARAKKLVEAARDQAGFRDHRYAGYRRLSAMLAKVCVEQKDYAGALQCLSDIDCAAELTIESIPEVIRLVVDAVAKPLGVAWP